VRHDVGVLLADLDGEALALRPDRRPHPFQVSASRGIPLHTLDLVVLAAEWGHGRRRGWLSNLHLGARHDSAPGEFVMLGRTFKGLTDAMLTWQTERLLELAFDGIQTSTRYPGGVALRFARVLRHRPDKRAEEADTLAAVVAVGAQPAT
jgi:DNA ligase-1